MRFSHPLLSTAQSNFSLAVTHNPSDSFPYHRQAGLELLLFLVSRVGNQKMSSVDSEKQLIMEAILPYKEQIIDVARKSLADNESQVTATASKITLTMAWWP